MKNRNMNMECYCIRCADVYDAVQHSSCPHCRGYRYLYDVDSAEEINRAETRELVRRGGFSESELLRTIERYTW